MVGKMGGRQILSLADGCVYDVGTPIHELMHALGNITVLHFSIRFAFFPSSLFYTTINSFKAGFMNNLAWIGMIT